MSVSRTRRVLLNGVAVISLLSAGVVVSDAHAWEADDYGVEMLEIREAAPRPVMKVSTTDGKEYDTASNNDLIYNVESKAQCRKFNYLQLAKIHIYPKNPQSTSDALGTKTYISKKKINQRTISTSWLPASIHVKPNNYLKEHAIKACNKELDKRISEGQNKFDILKTGFNVTMTKTTHHQFNLQCSGLSGGLTGNSWTAKNDHPVTVRCGSFVPEKASLDVSRLPSFKLVSASVSMWQTNYQGICPAKLPVKATITSTDFGGSFQYRFLEDGKAASGWKNKNVAKGKTVTELAHMITIQDAEKPQGQGIQGFQNDKIQNQGNTQVIPQMQEVPTRKVSIQVRRDTQQISNFKEYQATCKELKTATFDPKLKKVKLALPDLLSRTGIRIATKSSAWGGSISLSKQDAVDINPRGCTFRFRYDVANFGNADAKATHRLRGNGNVTLHTAHNFAVNKHMTRNLNGHILLPTGNYVLTASLDDPKKVVETNEDNNIYKVDVQVGEGCGGETGSSTRPLPTKPRPLPQPRPAGPQ